MRTTESVIQEIKQVHGNKYIIPSNFQYVNKRTKLHLICPKHGDFYPYYDNLIKKKCQCRKCLYHIYTTKEYIDDIKKIYPNNELDFSSIEYNGYRNDIIVKCNLCNQEHKVKPIRLLKGSFKCQCQKDTSSTLEKIVKNNLIAKQIEFEEQKKFPVYIHTQPWSWKAIFLYLSLGFKLQKEDTFSHYENEYFKAIGELKKIVSEKQFELLQELSES